MNRRMFPVAITEKSFHNFRLVPIQPHELRFFRCYVKASVMLVVSVMPKLELDQLLLLAVSAIDFWADAVSKIPLRSARPNLRRWTSCREIHIPSAARVSAVIMINESLIMRNWEFSSSFPRIYFQLTCGTSTIPNAVPAMEKPTAWPRFLSKNVFNATKDEAIARPVPRPVENEFNIIAFNFTLWLWDHL